MAEVDTGIEQIFICGLFHFRMSLIKLKKIVPLPLTLGELEALSRFGFTVFFAFHFAGVACEVPFVLKRFAKFFIQFDQGTVVDLINTPDEFLLAYIAEKEPADEMLTLPGQRDQIAAGIRQEKAQTMIQTWQDSILTEAGFEDLSSEDS